MIEFANDQNKLDFIFGIVEAVIETFFSLIMMGIGWKVFIIIR